MVVGADGPRRVQLHWNSWLVAASIAVSLLGAFTSTQLMCQARTSRNFSGVLLWTFLGSLTFGFCSIWSLHEVAMLAYIPDLPIGIDVPLTILSSILAVGFTFAALSSDLLWDRYKKQRQKRNSPRQRKTRPDPASPADSTPRSSGEGSTERLLPQEDPELDGRELPVDDLEEGHTPQSGLQEVFESPEEENRVSNEATRSLLRKPSFNIDPVQLLFKKGNNKIPANNRVNGLQTSVAPLRPSQDESRSGTENSSSNVDTSRSSEDTISRNSSSFGSNTSSFGLGNLLSIKPIKRSASPARNAFVATAKALHDGFTLKNILKGFLWSIAITSMHYTGLLGLEVPQGYLSFNPFYVVLSALISWVVCTVGCVLMAQMETHLTQQVLFSLVATTGVAGMHFTGMLSATFWSFSPPSDQGGYPPALAIAIAAIAITTCLAANALLAHSATISRNKLAEIVYTRRKLWMAIAQKENAESTAAARSEFIASLSHEIRTPLHHLQGHSDLLSRTELTEEGRLLLYAIQRATKTLSLITNNVLDWSRLERDGDTSARPVVLDIRTVCESIITLLPNEDEDVNVELMVVVAPTVPHALFLDETYILRILMNLLSNALKFTSSGYILLLVEMKDDKLVATVKDTGVGVPAVFLPQLFEPFKQAQTRGSSRGTGLGLSIIKQLLQKIDGTIEVESKHRDDVEDMEPDESGSTFIITVPAQKSPSPQDEEMSLIRPRIAIFHGGLPLALQGLKVAWENFGFEVSIVEKYSDLNQGDWKYIWADIPYLKQNPDTLSQLLEQDHWTILVPCDQLKGVVELPQIANAPQFVPLQRPLIWHTIAKTVAELTHPLMRSKSRQRPRAVHFASKVNVLEGINMDEMRTSSSPSPSRAHRTQDQTKSDSPPQPKTILLVEDNPINRKLGMKMLTTLGYTVLTADDGVEAITQVLAHDLTIDAILMDQSMPRKDGLTATREIREMEASGKLKRRRPIIAVTAVVSEQAKALCRLAGTDDFLSKPLSLGGLEESLKVHLKGPYNGPPKNERRDEANSGDSGGTSETMVEEMN